MPAAAAPAGKSNLALALLYGNPLARLFEFTLGMTMAMVVASAFHDRVRLSTTVATALETALLFGIVCGSLLGRPSGAAMGRRARHVVRLARVSPRRRSAPAPCLLYAPLIVLLAIGTGRVAKLLARPLPVVLGESSYSLYICSNVMLVPVMRNPQWLDTWSIGMRTLLGFAVVIAASLLLWYFFERPTATVGLPRTTTARLRPSTIASA
jgi:peptidoglycan/LPS O-acetylase OafA/YrhL